MELERRLVFGDVAELYDQRRPAYPQQLIDDLLDMAGARDGARVLEVGAGTGKATALVAARGVGVLAIEPSAAMAEVGRRNCERYPRVEFLQSDFERWDPAGETFGLLYCAQAWHWIEPSVRYRRARAALAHGGLLAAFWNRAAWGRSPLRDSLLAAYREAAPDMDTDGTMHPANDSPDGEEDWEGEIAAADGFDGGEIRYYRWSQNYSGAEYAGLVATLSETRLLDADQRQALLTGVAAAIDAHDGTLTMPMATRVCLARAV